MAKHSLNIRPGKLLPVRSRQRASRPHHPDPEEVQPSKAMGNPPQKPYHSQPRTRSGVPTEKTKFWKRRLVFQCQCGKGNRCLRGEEELQTEGQGGASRKHKISGGDM